VGSIFKNVAWDLVPDGLKAREDIKSHIKHDPFPVIPAAFLIDQVGLKGVSCGGAMVSQKHPNFIVNACGAEAEDVKDLVALVKACVMDEFGIALHEEIEYA
jgi:UDP-N-acetylmuramate dehydrogenase